MLCNDKDARVTTAFLVLRLYHLKQSSVTERYLATSLVKMLRAHSKHATMAKNPAARPVS